MSNIITPTVLINIVTPSILKTLGAKGIQSRLDNLDWAFSQYADVYHVNTIERISMFWAQTAYESGGFQYLEELGNQDYFSKYDNRADLGNNQPGDGYRFKGRGIIQLTGRLNYTKFGALLGLDLVNNPSLARDITNATRIALEYWRIHNLNVPSDQEDVETVTKRINGGLNGLDARGDNYDKAWQIATDIVDAVQDHRIL